MPSFINLLRTAGVTLSLTREHLLQEPSGRAKKAAPLVDEFQHYKENFTRSQSTYQRQVPLPVRMPSPDGHTVKDVIASLGEISFLKKYGGITGHISPGLSIRSTSLHTITGSKDENLISHSSWRLCNDQSQHVPGERSLTPDPVTHHGGFVLPTPGK
ncbi:hypothetical protein Bbelb_148500 [Branchiostoma belcheri]|nr:hypothetical protein Bbelb_148500 [Branchiostoma belcheri]